MGTAMRNKIDRFPQSRPRRGSITFGLFILIIGAMSHAQASALVPQTPLDGSCIPKFATALPVFGPAGSTPRVNAVQSSALTVTMKEIDQQVLPKGKHDLCARGVKFGTTRVWAYETTDTATQKVLGPANWPAVTLETQAQIATQIQFVNALPSFNPANPSGPGLIQGLFLVDQTLHWADPLQQMCGMETRDCSASANAADPCCRPYIGPVPATVHLHGGVIPAHFDGGPDSWFTPDGKSGPGYFTMGNPGAGKTIYEYPNAQEAGTLWFHDHTLGVTRLNVAAGLAGFYFIRDPEREPKQLPRDAYEIELALQDRRFDTNSQLYFPVDIQLKEHPFWSVLFEGDVAMVNGAPWPYFDVEPRRYRLRLLNGSNHRSYNLGFAGAKVYQIGSDDGYLNSPVLIDKVHLTPGERADLIVDFSGLAGRKVLMTNYAPGEMFQLPVIMRFHVDKPLQSADKSCDPGLSAGNGGCVWPELAARLTDGKGHIRPSVKIDKVRQIVINENFSFPTTLEEFVNNTRWDGRRSPGIAAKLPRDGISEKPKIGSIELWEIINAYAPGDARQFHPIHTHLAQFQVLNRQLFDVDGYLAAWGSAFGKGPAPLPDACMSGNACQGYGPPRSYNKPNADGVVGGNPAVSPFLLDEPIPPTAGEYGWKDTVTANGHQVLRVLVRWTPTDTPVRYQQSYAGRNLYPFDPGDGEYVWHCHIINHEDNEMMRPYKVAK